MKLSTKIRYGVRAMIDIGSHCSDRHVPLKEVARRQRVSAKYLEAIMPALKAAGLVRSVKGPGGGYSLALPAGEITLYDVVSALEGPVGLVDCVKRAGSCASQSGCASNEVWEDLSRLINRRLKSVTVGELMERQNRKKSEARDALLYNI